MKEEIIEKIKKLYEEMQEIDNSRILKKCETGDLCFYLGTSYIRKAIRELENEKYE